MDIIAENYYLGRVLPILGFEIPGEPLNVLFGGKRPYPLAGYLPSFEDVLKPNSIKPCYIRFLLLLCLL